jgi:hypothetical protein
MTYALLTTYYLLLTIYCSLAYCLPFRGGNNIEVLPIAADGWHGTDCYTHATMKSALHVASAIALGEGVEVAY